MRSSRAKGIVLTQAPRLGNARRTFRDLAARVR
jgi:hypothetical protein